MSEHRAVYRTRRNRRTTGSEAMHLLVAEARKEAVEGRGVYIPAVLHDGITHAELQRLAVDALVACGYRCYYTPDSRMNPSGFPDLVAVSPASRNPLIYCEIKVGDDDLKPAQLRWFEDLGATKQSGITMFLLRPRCWQSFLDWVDDGHVQRGRALLRGEDQNNGTS